MSLILTNINDYYLNDRINELEDRLGANNYVDITTITMLENSISSNTNKINDNFNQIVSNVQQMNLIQDEIMSNYSLIGSNFSKIDTLENSFVSNITQINTLENLITINTDKINNNSDKINDNTDDIKDNSNSIITANSIINLIRSDIYNEIAPGFYDIGKLEFNKNVDIKNKNLVIYDDLDNSTTILTPTGNILGGDNSIKGTMNVLNSSDELLMQVRELGNYIRGATRFIHNSIFELWNSNNDSFRVRNEADDITFLRIKEIENTPPDTSTRMHINNYRVRIDTLEITNGIFVSMDNFTPQMLVRPFFSGVVENTLIRNTQGGLVNASATNPNTGKYVITMSKAHWSNTDKYCIMVTAHNLVPLVATYYIINTTVFEVHLTRINNTPLNSWFSVIVY